MLFLPNLPVLFFVLALPVSGFCEMLKISEFLFAFVFLSGVCRTIGTVERVNVNMYILRENIHSVI